MNRNVDGATERLLTSLFRSRLVRGSLGLLFLISFGAVAGPAIAQPPIPFEAPWVAYNTAYTANGGDPVALTTGDFDGDGDQDVVTAVARSSTGFVFLRNDQGRLDPPQHRTGVSDAWDIIAADFNNDNKLDVVISNANTFQTSGNTISLFLGNGDGTFGVRQNFSIGSGSPVPIGLAAADFDGDTDLDLAVAAYRGASVRLLLNNGAGTFGAPLSFSAGPMPYKIVAGDVTGDGRPDVVVANDNYQVTVLKNNAAGGFLAPVTYSGLGNEAYNIPLPAIELADVDGDTDLDIFYSNNRTRNGEFGHAVQLRNNGTGTFVRGPDVSFAFYTAGPIDLEFADLNGDSAPDLIAAHYSGRTNDGVMIVLNDGNGNFGAAASYSGGQATYAVAAAEMNGDGAIDVLTADDYSLAVTVRFNNGAGVFPVLPDDFAESTQFYLDAADIDGDDDLDVFTSGAGPSAVQGSVLKNDGTGRFPVQIDVAVPVNGVAWGKLRDLNNDGFPDLLFNNPNTASQSDFFTALNNGNGTFPPPTRWTVISCGWGHVDAFDLDNDGDLDVVDMEALGGPGCSPKFWVALNQGNGTFAAPYSVGLLPYRPYGVAGGDFNGDGDIDLAMSAWGAYGFDTVVMVALGNGNGTFQLPVASYTVARGPKEIITADLDGDTHLDLAVSSTGYDDGAGNIGEEHLTLLFGTGTGTFNRITTYYAPFSPDLLGAGGVRAGDVDADGDLDVMLQAASNDISIYLNDGAGTFTFPYRMGFTNGAHNPYWGDFTGDEVADLAAVRNRPPLGFDSGVAVLPGISSPVTSTPPAVDIPAIQGLALAAPAPNPGRDITQLSLVLSDEQRVAVSVYDVLGRRVAVVHEGILPAGEHRFPLKVSQLSPGTYFVRAFGAASTPVVRRLTVIR